MCDLIVILRGKTYGRCRPLLTICGDTNPISRSIECRCLTLRISERQICRAACYEIIGKCYRVNAIPRSAHCNSGLVNAEHRCIRYFNRTTSTSTYNLAAINNPFIKSPSNAVVIRPVRQGSRQITCCKFYAYISVRAFCTGLLYWFSCR